MEINFAKTPCVGREEELVGELRMRRGGHAVTRTVGRTVGRATGRIARRYHVARVTHLARENRFDLRWELMR